MPALAVLLAIVIVGFIVAGNKATFSTGSGLPSATVLEPAFTLRDVREIAIGKPFDRSLAQALADECQSRARIYARQPGDQALTVGFFNAQGKRRQSWSIGWPSAWYTRTTYSLYKDAIDRSGFRPMRTMTPEDNPNVIMPHGQLVPPNASIDDSGLVWPRERWSFGKTGPDVLSYRAPPEETGGQAVWHDARAFAFTSALGVVALGWILPTILVWVINVTRGRGRPRLRGRWLRLLGILIAVSAIAWLTIDSVARTDVFAAPTGPTTTIGSGLNTIHRHAGMEHSALRVSTIHQLAAEPDSDQRAAQAILTLTDQSNNDNDYLALAVTPEAVMQDGSSTYYCREWPLVSTRSGLYVRRPDLGSPERLTNPAGTTVKFSSSLQITRSTGDPNIPERMLLINFGTLGMLIVGLFALWLLSKSICRVVTSAIARRRRRRNQCIACGHALGPPLR